MSSATKEDQQIWRFIKANFSENPRVEFLDLLGFNSEENAQTVRIAAILVSK